MQHLENNYVKQVRKAEAYFLNYDQEEIIRRNGLTADADWLYARLLDLDLRVDRRNGGLELRRGDGWLPCDGYAEPMVLLDILCDSKPGRRPLGTWKSTLEFGYHVHRGLAEETRATPLEQRLDREPELLARRCLAMGGRDAHGLGGADAAWVLPFFQTLEVLVQFWHGDEEFPPKLTILWDAGAGNYLRYETMYYALDLIRSRLGAEA